MSIFRILVALLFANLLFGCSENNRCASISDHDFEELVRQSIEKSKLTSDNGKVLGRFHDKQLSSSILDREELRYDPSAVGVMIFFDKVRQPIFEARLYNDCEVQWIYR